MSIGICYNTPMEFDRKRFSQYIQDQFFDWRGKSERTWTEFADYIDVTQQTMAAWKNGYLKRVPNQENINKLVKVFGFEIYEILGIPMTEDPLESLPEPTRSVVKMIREEHVKYGVTPGSSESMAIQEKILKQFGFEVIDKKD